MTEILKLSTQNDITKWIEPPFEILNIFATSNNFPMHEVVLEQEGMDSMAIIGFGDKTHYFSYPISMFVGLKARIRVTNAASITLILRKETTKA